LCARRKIVTRLSGNCDNPFFLIVSILPMAAKRSIKIPAVTLDEFDYVADLHRFDPDNCVFLGQLRTLKHLNTLWRAVRSLFGFARPERRRGDAAQQRGQVREFLVRKPGRCFAAYNRAVWVPEMISFTRLRIRCTLIHSF